MRNFKDLQEKWFVTMTDSFFSGWGKAPNTNKLIFLCDNLEEAEIVESNAKSRGDQKYVRIGGKPPKYFRIKLFEEDAMIDGKYVQLKTKDDYKKWYVKDYFKKTN